MKRKILADFQIWISVPLTSFFTAFNAKVRSNSFSRPFPVSQKTLWRPHDGVFKLPASNISYPLIRTRACVSGVKKYQKPLSIFARSSTIGGLHKILYDIEKWFERSFFTSNVIFKRVLDQYTKIFWWLLGDQKGTFERN